MCPFCFGVNGEHRAGCSRGANVVPLPRKLTIKIVNRSKHTLAIRPTVDPTVYEVVCGHPDREQGVDLLALGAFMDKSARPDEPHPGSN